MSKAKRRCIAVWAAATCAAACAPAVAPAAVTIGGDVTASGSAVSCGGDADHPAACDVAQTVLAGGRAAAPVDGVVVRWRVGGATGPLALRVVRPAAFTYSFVSTSVVETPASTGVETFTTRRPIRAGDYVGVELGPGSWVGAPETAPADDTIAAWNPVPDGQSAAPIGYRAGFSVAYNADVEPDADHDGYGDETQDQCPTDASTQGVCPPPPAPAATSTATGPDRTPPVLSASARSARLSRRGSISLFISSSETATALVAGTIRVPRLVKAVRFARRSVALAAGRPTKITLRLSRYNAPLVRRSLRRRVALKARITVSASDGAGNASAARFALRLRR